MINDHLSTATTILGFQFQFSKRKATYEQRPHVNNGHNFWVPRVVVIHKFDCTMILRHHYNILHSAIRVSRIRRSYFSCYWLSKLLQFLYLTSAKILQCCFLQTIKINIHHRLSFRSMQIKLEKMISY